MATLLHFLRSLAVSLLTGFVLSLVLLSFLLICLMGLHLSPIAFIADHVYLQLSRFLTIFGSGDRLEGIVAIALALGVAFSLLNGFDAYKRRQRSEWHLAMSNFPKD